MPKFNDHCADTTDEHGRCVVVVDGDYGQFKPALCECECHADEDED